MIHHPDHGTWTTIAEARTIHPISQATLYRWLKRYNIRTTHTYPVMVHTADLQAVINSITKPPLPENR